jgi:hypothetical protein
VRNLRALDDFRIPNTPYEAADIGGAFLIPYPLAGMKLRCVATNGDGWDHVSVSLPGRTPTWAEMDYAKRTFFHEHEVAMQLHVAEDKHINVHPYCLHLWRPHRADIPLPPRIMV